METRIIHNPENETLILPYGGNYEIDLDRIKSERDLMAWMFHLCEKNWMNTSRLRELGIEVCKIKGFKPYGL